jgi:hypothetical protein
MVSPCLVKLAGLNPITIDQDTRLFAEDSIEHAKAGVSREGIKWNERIRRMIRIRKRLFWNQMEGMKYSQHNQPRNIN